MLLTIGMVSNIAHIWLLKSSIHALEKFLSAHILG